MNTKTRKYIVLVAVIALVIGAVVFFTRGKQSSNAANTSFTSTSNDIEAAVAIGREFDFPIKDEKGDEITRFKYTIESVEIRKDIIVKGQKATSVDGRKFLILNVKLSNTLDKMVQINTRDYVRLIRNGNPNEQLAPDVHNDPVEVQAISTKLTRIAFPINSTDTDLQIQVGEIKGEKQLVPIVFN